MRAINIPVNQYNIVQVYWIRFRGFEESVKTETHGFFCIMFCHAPSHGHDTSDPKVRRRSHSPPQVNLSVGAYRTEEGKPWILPSVAEAEKMVP